MKLSHSISKAFALLASISFSTVVFADEDVYVGCGSAIKLAHVESGGKHYLNSAGMNLGSGSGQQIVTAVPDRTKNSALWIVKEASGDDICLSGTKVKCGTKIRLTHKDTGRNLHSHSIRSPLSNQQEVTAFGDNGEGDEGDDWIVQCKSQSSKFLMRGQRFYLKHAATQRYLGASNQLKFTQQNCGGRCPVLNHLEVFGRSRADIMTEWYADVGVFLSQE